MFNLPPNTIAIVVAALAFCAIAAVLLLAACAQSSRVSWHQRARVHRDGTHKDPEGVIGGGG